MIRTIILLGLLSQAVHGWWDWGHMLPLAILRHRAQNDSDNCELKVEHIAKIEKLMSHWNSVGLYPMAHKAGLKYEFLGPLPDYIKWTAGRDNEFDRGMADNFYDELHYFNPESWLDDKVTGEKVDLNKEYAGPMGDETHLSGVTGFLKFLENNFLSQEKKSDRWTASSFLYNMAYYVHMMGDFHNPAHVGGMFAKCFKQANGFNDRGCNQHTLNKNVENKTNTLYQWSLMQSSASQPGNLHALWDSMAWYVVNGDLRVKGRTGFFGGYAEDMAKGSDSILYNDAADILRDFPLDKVKKGITEVCPTLLKIDPQPTWTYGSAAWMKDFEKKNVIEMARESEELNRKFVYGTRLQTLYFEKKNIKPLEDGCPKTVSFLTNLEFDNDYIENVNCLARLRVLMASYRLEKKLVQLIDSVDVDAIIGDDDEALEQFLAELNGQEIETPNSMAAGPSTIVALFAALGATML